MNSYTENKRGQKVSIKHYLNTKLKPRLAHDFSSGQSKEFYEFPLYVQVSVKRQVVRVKSMLDVYIRPDSFAASLSWYSVDLEKEKIILNDLINKANPFEDPDFNLNSSINYPKPIYDLSHIVTSHLFNSAYSLLNITFLPFLFKNINVWQRAFNNKSTKHQLGDEEVQSMLDEQKYPDAFVDITRYIQIDYKNVNTIVLLLSELSPPFKELWCNYEPEFWDFRNYVNGIKEFTGNRLITIYDWLSGDFERMFVQTYNDLDSFEAIKIGFNKMIEHDLEINKFVKSL